MRASCVVSLVLLAVTQDTNNLGRTTPEWLQDLGAPHERVRERAAWALGRIVRRPGGATEAVVTALRRALRDGDASVQQRALQALGAAGAAARPAVADLILLLPEGGDHLLPYLARPPELRVAVAETLGALGVVALPELTTALASDKVLVRAGAAWALAVAGSIAAPAVPALTRALADQDLEVQACAAAALGAIGVPAASAAPALTERLADKNQALRTAFAAGLLGVKPDAAEAVAVLAAGLQLRDAEPLAQALALGALARAGAVGAPPLRVLLRATPDLRVRAAAALLGCAPADEAARDTLEDALEARDAALRGFATRAYVEHVGADALPALETALKHLGPDRGLAAAAGLLRLRSPVPLVPAVLRAATADPERRNDALAAFAWIGPSAASLLRELQNSQDSRVAVRAAALLLEIEPDAMDADAVIRARLRDKLEPEPQPARTPAEAVRAAEALVEAVRGGQWHSQLDLVQHKIEAERELVRLGRPALPALAPYLRDADDEVRWVVALTAFRITREPGPAREVLIACLKGDDRDLSDRVRAGLSEAPETLSALTPALVPLLANESESVREDTLWLLCHAAPKLRPDDTVIVTLISALEARFADEKTQIRASAAGVVLTLRPAHERAAGVMTAALASVDEGIARSAFGEFMGMSNAGRRAVVPKVVAALRNTKDPATRLRLTTTALAGIRHPRKGTGGDDSVPRAALVELLDAADHKHRLEAANTLFGWYHDPRALLALVALAQDPDESIRGQAAMPLEMAGDESVPPLAVALTAAGAEPAARTAVAQVLARLGAPGLGVFAAALAHTDRMVRMTAAWALREVKDEVPTVPPADPKQLRVLARKAQADADPWVRLNAAESALELEPEDPAPLTTLAALLRDDAEDLAAAAGASLSAREKSALPALRALLTDPLPRTKERARKLIEAIDK